MPTFNRASVGQPVDYSGATQQQYDASLDRYNAKQAQWNKVHEAAKTAASAFMMFSDARLKENVVTVGILGSGLRVVHYRYRGLPCSEVGVIAQEALGFCPEAVAMHPSGYLMVDYSKVR
jgi:hypothetical protein